jgi:hypothetical protein
VLAVAALIGRYRAVLLLHAERCMPRLYARVSSRSSFGRYSLSMLHGPRINISFALGAGLSALARHFAPPPYRRRHSTIFRSRLSRLLVQRGTLLPSSGWAFCPYALGTSGRLPRRLYHHRVSRACGARLGKTCLCVPFAGRGSGLTRVAHFRCFFAVVPS